MIEKNDYGVIGTGADSFLSLTDSLIKDNNFGIVEFKGSQITKNNQNKVINNDKHEVDLRLPYSKKIGKLQLFLGWLLVFPAAIVLFFQSIIPSIKYCIGIIKVIFGGEIDKDTVESIRLVMQQNMRISAYATWLTDKKPGFSLKD